VSAFRRAIPIAVAVVAALVCWLGYLTLRDLSLFKVRHVSVKGLGSQDSPSIERALRETARRMTTLHVREGDLRRAVDAFPIVYSVSASADFPNGLEIRVVERLPVALAEGDGRRVPVAADGTLLPRAEKGTSVPRLKAAHLPPAGKLRDRKALALVRLLAGAPRELLPQLAQGTLTRRGFAVELRNGPELQFGDLSRLAAKWAAAARVLADPSARGARALDLRLPQRPAASGFREAIDEPAADAPTLPQP
jgi:cell division protein FtsQ